ncbi:MAG: DUF5684 domain-containing protein [Coriobacteriales bacterium]|jgi:hypothetical protein|nr:DUF5684 domain-containing protein [Coriobacteriales bacterium]
MGILAASNNYYPFDVADLALLTGYFVSLLIVGIAYYVLTAIFMMKIFIKANQEGWKAWIPFYNNWVFLELGGYKGWIALLALASVIPCIGFVGSVVAVVFLIMAAYQISLKLGKSGGWVALYFFFPFIWAAILGLGGDQWNDSLGKPSLTAERPPTYGTATYAATGYGAPAQQPYQQPYQQQVPPAQQPPQQQQPYQGQQPPQPPYQQ